MRVSTAQERAGAKRCTIARMRLVLAAVVVMCACGQAGTGADADGGRVVTADVQAATVALPYQGGTRLRAVTLVGDDGTRHFLRWWDTQLMIDCYPRTAGDQVVRCYPPGVSTPPLPLASYVAFRLVTE